MKKNKNRVITTEDIKFITKDVFDIMNKKEFRQFLNTLKSINAKMLPLVEEYLLEKLKDRHNSLAIKFYMKSIRSMSYEFIQELKIIRRNYLSQKNYGPARMFRR